MNTLQQLAKKEIDRLKEVQNRIIHDIDINVKRIESRNREIDIEKQGIRNLSESLREIEKQISQLKIEAN